MKKVLSALLAMLMISSMAMAQKSINAPLTKEAAKRAAAMRGVQHMAKPVSTPSAMSPKTLVTTFPYFENFENGAADWTLVDNDNDGFNWMLLSALGGNMDCHSGEDCMVSASYDNEGGSALTPDNWMISSGFQIPSDAANLELSWWDAAQDPSYAADHYSVYIATANTVAALSATTPVFSITLTSDAWTKRTVDLSSYAGQTIYVAFRHHNCSDMFIMKIDDVRIGGPEAPELSITVPAMAEENTVVNLSANVSGATSVDWIINGATPATATGIDVTASWAAAGTYQVIASATNAVGTVSDTANIVIYHCDIISEFPYTADFANGLGCWRMRADSADNPGWMTGAEAGLEDFNGLLSMSAESFLGILMLDIPTDNWLISPEIAVPATGDYELAWNVMPMEPSYAADHYTVYAIVGDDTTQVYTETLNGSITDFATRIVSLGNYAGQTIRVAFRHHESVGGYVMMLDQISVRTLSAPIVSISGPAYAIAGTQVTFVANSGNANTYAWTVDGADANCASNTLTTTFATAGTHTVGVTATNTVGSTNASATISVRECNNITSFPYTEGFDGGDLGCWTAIDADGDGYTWENRYFGVQDQDGSYYGLNNSEGCAVSASYINGVGPLTPDNYLVSPAIEIPAGSALYLSWAVRAMDPEYASDKYSVLVAAANTVEAFSAASPIFSETLTSDSYIHHGVDLSQYAGQTVYVAFRHHDCSDMYQMLFDNISLTQTVGIDDAEAVAVSMYPNPTTGILNINAENVQAVEVLDINGRRVMSQEEATLNMGSLANGVYFVRVITNNGISVKKVVKR